MPRYYSDGLYDENHLQHHGVLGMKWGIRRYQNPDGSLSAAGRTRLKEIYSSNQTKYDKKHYDNEIKSQRNAGINRHENYDVIKKGSVLRRYSSTNKEDLRRPKYVFSAKDDQRPYREMANKGYLSIEKNSDIWSYKMSAISDIKVARGQEVTDHIIKKYGDKSLKQAWKTYKNLDLRNNSGKTFGLKTGKEWINKQIDERYRNDKWAGEYAQKNKEDVYQGLNKILYKNVNVRSEIFDYYAKKGFDAIIDVEDWTGGFNYPLILLNPEKSIKVDSIRKIKK